ncbi:hypothetical protein COCOBI_02-6730 [Coccomyxa sp. Obi]|nr:hypothetical protein COCOBI_02-6730 [Coccomyxa sp. Obi]
MILRARRHALALGAGSGHSHSDFVLPNLGDIRKQWLQFHRSACTASPAAAYASARESRSSRGPASQWLDSALHEPQQHLKLLGLAASDNSREGQSPNSATLQAARNKPGSTMENCRSLQCVWQRSIPTARANCGASEAQPPLHAALLQGGLLVAHQRAIRGGPVILETTSEVGCSRNTKSLRCRVNSK